MKSTEVLGKLLIEIYWCGVWPGYWDFSFKLLRYIAGLINPGVHKLGSVSGVWKLVLKRNAGYQALFQVHKNRICILTSHPGDWDSRFEKSRTSEKMIGNTRKPKDIRQ